MKLGQAFVALFHLTSFGHDNLSLMLPTVNLQPAINIPQSIRIMHPLPQEELMYSYNQGNIYLMSGQFDEAYSEINNAIDISPNNAELYITRGIILEKLNRYEEAINDYRKANEIRKKSNVIGFVTNKDDPTIISNIANAETGLREYEKAMADFAYASRLQPDFIAPQIGKALVAYELDDIIQTKSIVSSILTKYPDFVDCVAIKAVLSMDEGNIKEAQENWEFVVDNDPRYNDLDWLRNIRRWTPKLVDKLEYFYQAINKQS